MSRLHDRGEGRPIVVVGAGGHAKVVIECLRFAGWTVIGCTDADPSPRSCAGAEVIGGDERLAGLRSEGVGHAFCALGGNALRDRIGERLAGMGFDLPAVVGPGSNLSPSASLGAGTIMMPGSSLNVESRVGPMVIVNTNASIDHDADIGRAAHVGPGAALAGEVSVGARSFVATGSAVVPRIRIGSDTIVGAGSVVVRDLPDRVVAFGNPARVIRTID